MSSATDPPESSAEESEILLLGVSFAGVELLYQLMRYFEGQPPSITVVDRLTHHGYIPLAQERLCGRLTLEESELDTRAYVESLPRARFVQGEVASLDPNTKTCILTSGKRLRARFVVVALGSQAAPPPSLRGVDQQLLTYKMGPAFAHARERLEAVLRDADSTRQVVVVGGGVSGVELAGELADLKRERPEGWHAPQVTLVTASAQLLPDMGERLGAKVLARLQAQGVEVRLRARVTEVHDDGLTLSEGQGGQGAQTVELPAALSFWAAGLRPAGVLDQLGLARTDRGWLAVGPTLQCSPTAKVSSGMLDLFACGDAVRVLGGNGPWATMQRAIECIWQANVVAHNIHALHKEPASYPSGPPPLRPHRLRREFFYGISLGARSLVAYRGVSVDIPGLNHWFRRWLMRQYFARYRPVAKAVPSSSAKALRDS